MNKTGADKIISVYWFAILFIVAAAVVYMVFSFYGEPYDARKLEANALTNQVAGCVAEAGYLKEGIFENLGNDFLGTCSLNLETEDAYGWGEQEQYYIKIDFLDFSSDQTLFSAEEGNENLKDFCELEGKNFPFCLERSFYVIDKSNNQYRVNILSIVRKTEKNVQ